MQLSHDLNVAYQTAFVLAHKLREAMAIEIDTGEAMEGEVDGAYFGRAKLANYRIDRRKAENQTGKRRVVVVIRERDGRALPFVVKSEAQSIVTIGEYVAPTATVYADEARSRDALHARFLTKRINHEVRYSDGEPAQTWQKAFSAASAVPRLSNGAPYLGIEAALNAPLSRQ